MDHSVNDYTVIILTRAHTHTRILLVLFLWRKLTNPNIKVQ